MLQASISDRKSTGPLSLRAGDSEGRDVRGFGAFTGDLCALADWLKQCEIETVAMESTGVYWIALYELLVERGFEVLLVDAHLRIATRCVSPRRSSLHPTQLPASTFDVGNLCFPSHPAHAKGARADEPKACPRG